MRKSIIAGVLFGLVAVNAVASPEVIVSCDTQQGKQLEVIFNKSDDGLVVNYGTDLDTPKYSVVKKTNDMFWNSEYNSPQKVKDTIMYFIQGDEQGKFTVTDYGDHTLVTLNVDRDNQVILEDACRDIKQFNFSDQLTANMAWVDDN